MPEYFYTVDLGQTYGPKLEKLAAMASYDDVEAFARLLLAGAIDQVEEEEEAELKKLMAAADEAEKDAARAQKGGCEDDGIPF